MFTTNLLGKCAVAMVGRMAMAILMITTIVPFSASYAQTYSILHSFTGGLSGAYPYDGLTMDRAGNLYGTTESGGSADQGMVFKLSNHNGSWTFTALYSFTGGNDGARPYAGVTIGPDGALYGATSVGGLGNPNCPGGGCGTVYKLTPPARICSRVQCPWTETVLYRFVDSPTGVNYPWGRVIFDAAGNLYGTTVQGGTGGCGSPGCGAVYKLSPNGGGWVETTIYSFTGQGDGATPYDTLAMDGAANLYGTTYYASIFSGGYGTVFELSPSGGGWTEHTLYTFQGGTDGGNPEGGVILDSAGNLYGATTESNIGVLEGVAFELSPSGGGWTYSVLSALSGSVGQDLSLDSAGNLYGTGIFGGIHGFGYVFKLTNSGGAWTQTDLHDFNDEGGDGFGPFSTVVFDAAGNLYGTTNGGGSGFAGVVWEISH